MADKLWKPNLAAKPEPEELDKILATLNYPLLGSIKWDGVRATVQNGILMARALTPIANIDMQAMWGRSELNGLDGEVIVGDPTAEDCFNITSGVARSRTRRAEEATFYVFDTYHEDEPFRLRALRACAMAAKHGSSIVYTKQETLNNLKQLLAYEARMTKLRHEGIMLRDPEGRYKQGRSTLREGGLIAVKRFVDAEAVILATYEQEENTNEQKKNELGQMKRSTHKAGKVGKDTLGGFTVMMVGELTGRSALERMQTVLQQYPKDDRLFNIGAGQGLTDPMRKELWARRKKLPGQIIKFRYQKVGTMVKPRQPIFLGFRDKADL